MRQQKHRLPRRNGIINAVVGVTLLLCVFGAPTVAAADAFKRVAVLDIELLKPDYYPSPHNATSDEQRRLDMVADLLRSRLEREGSEPSR